MFHFIEIIHLFISFYRNYPAILFAHNIFTYQSRGEALFSAGKWRSPILSFIAIPQTLQNTQRFYSITLYSPTNLAPDIHQNILKKKTFAPSPTGGNNSKQKEREVGTLRCFYYSILYTLPSSYQLISHSYYFEILSKKKTFAPSPTGGNNSKQKEREK